MDGTILVADDDRTIRTVLTQALTRAGCRVHATSSMATLMRWIDEGKGDLVITDVIMPDGNGLEALTEISARRPALPVIVISAQSTIRTAVEAAEREAYDYLPKPFDLPDLMARSARALRTQRRVSGPRSPDDDAGHVPSDDLPLVGRSAAMQALYRRVARVTQTDLSVLVIGESGAGKQLVARAIHDFSDRRAGAFAVASPAEFSDMDAMVSLFARVRGGTVLLDEVGDLDGEAQARLVRILDGLESGGARIIATSQKDLGAGLGGHGFRQDLYYRISGISISIPPLRDRLDDIPLLAEYFLANSRRDGLPPRRLSAEAMNILRAYSWPGNVRQLENTIRHIAVASVGEEISGPEADAVLDGQPGMLPPHEGDRDSLGPSVARYLQRHFDRHDGVLPLPGLYQRVLREIERPLIEIALDATAGNQAKCADVLGINRNTLRKKITDLGIRVTRSRKLM